ncbi:2Fe-2S iron-sulfur cluster binding domain-containing protein [candidate division KSB1 bacterium]|nr:2Fe-2S iron-sulfur cluster binding domain-containing protein [candidate division KSB1 bacterium]
MTPNILTTVFALSGISGLLAVLLVIAERFLANYGECKVTINDDKELIVQGGSTLLTTLGSEKIFLPSACGGRGTCAYCKCKVVEGAGPVLPTEAPMLTPDDVKNNIRLACQVKVKQDFRIEIPEELFNIKEFKSTITSIRDLTYDIKLVRFELDDPNEISFKPGQYIQVYTEPYGDVKESISRAYSIASPHTEKSYIDLMIRLVPDGICTTWVHQHVSEQQRVKLVGPMGDFYVRDGDGEMIMIAGGSGMAPFVPILHDMKNRGVKRKVTYFFGAVSKRDLFYIDEMKALEQELADFTFVPALSEPAPDDNWDGETGLITQPLANYIRERDMSNAHAYLCGSPGMIHACIIILNKYGITEDRIFFDPFS